MGKEINDLLLIVTNNMNFELENPRSSTEKLLQTVKEFSKKLGSKFIKQKSILISNNQVETKMKDPI